MTDIQAHRIPCERCGDSGFTAYDEEYDVACRDCRTGVLRTYGFSEPCPKVSDKIIVQPSWCPAGRVAVECGDCGGTPISAGTIKGRSASGRVFDATTTRACNRCFGSGYLTVTLTMDEAKEWCSDAAEREARAALIHATVQGNLEAQVKCCRALAAADMLKGNDG